MDGAVVFQLPWHLKKCEVEQVYLWSWGDVNLPLCGIGKRVWFCRGVDAVTVIHLFQPPSTVHRF